MNEISKKLNLSSSKVYRLLSNKSSKATMGKAPWTVEDNKYLRKNINKMPIFMIAAEMDKPVADVIHRIQQIGVCGKQLEGEFTREYSDKFNVRYNNTSNWTDEETAELLNLMTEGYEIEQIADIMDRTPGSVQAKITRIKSREEMESVNACKFV